MNHCWTSEFKHIVWTYLKCIVGTWNAPWNSLRAFQINHKVRNIACSLCPGPRLPGRSQARPEQDMQNQVWIMNKLHKEFNDTIILKEMIQTNMNWINNLWIMLMKYEVYEVNLCPFETLLVQSGSVARWNVRKLNLAVRLGWHMLWAGQLWFPTRTCKLRLPRDSIQSVDLWWSMVKHMTESPPNQTTGCLLNLNNARLAFRPAKLAEGSHQPVSTPGAIFSQSHWHRNVENCNRLVLQSCIVPGKTFTATFAFNSNTYNKKWIKPNGTASAKYCNHCDVNLISSLWTWFQQI